MRTLLTAIFVAAGWSCFSQPIDTIARIDQIFSSWNHTTPGGVITVSRGEKMIYNKAYGLADLERLVPNTTNSIFEAGSISKQFTAFSILLLEADGKLSLSDDIRKYIPELPDYGQKITIWHLMTHTSGVKDWGSIIAISGWPRGSRVHTLDLALKVLTRQKTLNYKPGEEYLYSNGNYSLLVAIVERVSKQSLAEFTSEKLFKPLGMTNTQWRDDYTEVIAGRSQAYSKNGGVYHLDMPFENIHGHGGLLTTTDDLLKWNKLLESYQLGGPGLFKKRTTRATLNNGQQITYAAGINVSEINHVQQISHSGATAGYRAWLAYYPSLKISVALLSNDGNFSPATVGEQIGRIFTGTEQPVKPAPDKSIQLSEADAGKWSGIYKSIRSFDVVNLKTGGQQVLWNDRALKAIHADTLAAGAQKFSFNKKGNLMISSLWDSASYVKVLPAKSDEATLKQFVGSYISDEALTNCMINLKDGKLQLTLESTEKQILEPAFKDAFQLNGYSLFESTRDKKGIVNGFKFSTGRAENIIFTKSGKP